jgi:hypothetical protein
MNHQVNPERDPVPARLASQLGTPLAEFPGNHAGMIQHPAQFAARLQCLLRQPPATRAATRLPAAGEPQ